MSDINLPAIVDHTVHALSQVTNALGVPRDMIASDGEIAHAWQQLPRLLAQIPRNAIDEQHVRMCVAVSAGLFDSAVNYAWNSAIVALKTRVRNFGLVAVSQILSDTYDEQKLAELKDAELLTSCLKLNLISEDAYFFLDQCRAVRNSFSAAHPPLGSIDADEFVVFLSRCGRYALTATENPRGVDSAQLVTAVKNARYSDAQRDEWVQRLSETHDQQRVALISMLHGIYCDPTITEEARLNSLDICAQLVRTFSPEVVSELVNRHSNYIAEGKDDRQRASRLFFEKLGIVEYLTDAERHTMLSIACQQLMNVHQGYDNFYNEPPFAQRLRALALQAGRPRSIHEEYVHTVLACGIGNPYGVSRAAYPDYAAMVRNFSPAEVDLMLRFPGTRTIVGNRIETSQRCHSGFADLVRLIDQETVLSNVRQAYEQWKET